MIGDLEELRGDLLFERLRDAFLIGILVIMALYHLGIFSQRTKDTTSLWFGLLCLAVAIRQISTSRFIEILSQPASSAQFEAREMLEYGSMIIGLPLAMLFVANLIPGRWIMRVAYLVAAGCSLYLLMILTQPALVYSAWVDFYQVMLFVSMAAFVLHAIFAWIRGNRLAGLTLMGFLPMVLAATNDVLVGKGYLDTPFLSPYGFGALILIQSYILASRFSLAYRTAERLSENLQTEVEAQTQALRDQTSIAVQLKSQAEEAKLESDRLRLEAEKHADDLRELDRAKTEFFQNMSHELRTPLTLMLLPLERYVAEHSSAPGLEMAIRNGRRLQRMVNQLLDLQKSEAGKFHYNFSTIDCIAFGKKFADYFEPAAVGQGVAFTVGVDAHQPLYISCDVDGLEKIIFNFLSNALKFTPVGGSIRLDIGLNPDSKRVRWSVIDTGIGIRRSEQAKVFDVFSQADGSTTREYEGTGLGLALCKTLTEEMGGVIGLSSEIGEGSEFFVEFDQVVAKEPTSVVDSFEPRVWLRPDQEFESQQSALLKTMSTDTIGQLLVVDDVPDMREIIVQVLESSGYSCTTAKDGVEALEALKKSSFDLIVSDWMMPNISGPELITRLRERETVRQTPVILLTAKSDDTSRFQAFDTGADGFLGKPFKPEELIALVRNLLLLKEREFELEELLVELRETQDRMLVQAQLATVGNMAQGLAHEIRNPLNFVRGGTELLADEMGESSEIPAAVKLIERGIDRIESIVTHVQELAEGRQEGYLSRVQVKKILESTVEIVRLSQFEQAVDFRIVCDEQLRIKTDEKKLSQVVLNLLLNASRALKDNPDARVELRVEWSQREGRDGMSIAVADNGQGIPAELVSTIFEPFVTRTSDDSGTGLGLTISRQMIESINGTLELVDNEQGATFAIWLPKE